MNLRGRNEPSALLDTRRALRDGEIEDMNGEIHWAGPGEKPPEPLMTTWYVMQTGERRAVDSVPTERWLISRAQAEAHVRWMLERRPGTEWEIGEERGPWSKQDVERAAKAGVTIAERRGVRYI